MSSDSNYDYGFCIGLDLQTVAYRLPVPLVDFVLPLKMGTPVVLTRDFDWHLRTGAFCLILDVIDRKMKFFNVHTRRVFNVGLQEDFECNSKKSVSYFPVKLALAAQEHSLQGECINAIRVEVD